MNAKLDGQRITDCFKCVQSIGFIFITNVNWQTTKLGPFLSATRYIRFDHSVSEGITHLHFPFPRLWNTSLISLAAVRCQRQFSVTGLDSSKTADWLTAKSGTVRQRGNPSRIVKWRRAVPGHEKEQNYQSRKYIVLNCLRTTAVRRRTGRPAGLQ